MPARRRCSPVRKAPPPRSPISAARLTLLADGLAFARHGDPDFAATLAGLRRAIELDRFGIAAHVLAVRDGCTAERCAAFALLQRHRT